MQISYNTCWCQWQRGMESRMCLCGPTRRGVYQCYKAEGGDQVIGQYRTAVSTQHCVDNSLFFCYFHGSLGTVWTVLYVKRIEMNSNAESVGNVNFPRTEYWLVWGKWCRIWNVFGGTKTWQPNWSIGLWRRAILKTENTINNKNKIKQANKH